MKKRVNPRIPVAAALAVVAGVAFGYALSYYNASLLWLIATVPFTAAGAVLALIRKRLKPAIFTLLALVLFFGGFFNCYSRLYIYSQDILDNGESYNICGKISEKGSVTYCDYMVLSGVTADGQALNGKVIVYLYGSSGEECEIGYTASFTASLTKLETFPYGELNYNAENNVKYSCNLYYAPDCVYGFSLFGSARTAIRGALFDNLSTDTAAVCYAMLTGNTQDIESGLMESFRYGGVAHIFAVSGLHIGILFGVLNWIFKKLRLNKYLSACLCAAVIIIYLGICGFTLSSVRAAIMCAVLTVSRLFFRKYDGLNSLAVAVTIILFITPLSLFSVGFQLSVCAIGGISVLSGNINYLMRKIKIPTKLRGAASASFGAQLGTMPIMLANFGYLSGAGLLLNIVLIPLFSAVFVLIFFCTIFSAAIPLIAPIIMPVAALPMELIISFLAATSFESALISGFGAGLFVPLYFICILSISDKIHLKPLKRLISVAVAAAVLTVYVLGETYLPFSGFRIIVCADTGGGEVIIKSSRGTVLIVYDGVSSSSVFSALNEYYSLGIDGVIILGGEDCVTAYGELGIDCKDVYLCALYINLQPYDGVEIHYERIFTLCGVNFEFIDGYNLVADCGGITLGVSAGDVAITSCDLLVSKKENEVCESRCTVYFRMVGQKYNIYEYGNLTFYASGEKLSILGIIPNR